MAIDDADPRETAKAREHQVEDGMFLGGDDFPPNTGDQGDSDADPSTIDQQGDTTVDSGEDGAAGNDSIEWPEDVSVPDRLKGKDLGGIAKEFSSMQTEFGRQSNELGEIRGVMRDLVAEQLLGSKSAPSDDAKPITTEDLDTNPDAALDAVVERKVKPIAAKFDEATLKLQVAQLGARFPGWQNQVQTAEFKEWVAQSPYRASMFKRANNYDFDAAEELLVGFTETQTAAQENKSQAVRQQQTVTGRSAGGTGKVRGKVYRASDIADLYTRKRDRYNELLPEFEKAWAEGRVK